jgi:hypothetical protein
MYMHAIAGRVQTAKLAWNIAPYKLRFRRDFTALPVPNKPSDSLRDAGKKWVMSDHYQ